MPLPFFTIGHSTRTVEAFVELLQVGEVKEVVDIRTIPRSRANPQYNADTFPESLRALHVKYTRIEELGGLQRKSKTIPPEVNGWWENQSFHNYADYALGERFKKGLEQLITLGRKRRCVIMCSEAVWWRCHRRIVADYLLMLGEEVFHIMDGGKLIPATRTESAVTLAPNRICYPAPTLDPATLVNIVP